NAAVNDLIKRRKIAAHVQRKTVHGDPMTNTYANGSNLAVADPDSGERFTSRSGNAVSGEKLNEQSLEPPQILVQILTTSAEIDNRISHQLAWSMICRLTSTIDCEKWMRQMRRAQFATANPSCGGQTRLIRSATNGVNRLMLEQEQFVQMGRIFSLLRDDFFLQSKSTSEVHPAKPTHVKINNRCFHIRVAPGTPKLATSCERR